VEGLREAIVRFRDRRRSGRQRNGRHELGTRPVDDVQDS